MDVATSSPSILGEKLRGSHSGKWAWDVYYALHFSLYCGRDEVRTLRGQDAIAFD